jgi:uncharacterized protein involved in response to NO
LQAVYAIAAIAALARIAAALSTEIDVALLHVAALSWALAFLGFSALYGPLLCRAKRPAKPVSAATRGQRSVQIREPSGTVK